MGGRVDYGPPIAPRPGGGHDLRYSSPSTLTTADPSSDGGCLRKAWYQVILKIRSPTSKSQQVGIDLHAEIERYHLTSEKKLGPLAMSGFHMIEPPGTDLLVEKAIAPSLEAAPVRYAGVSIVGYIDLVHARGTNRGGTSVEDIYDPPNTVEVVDYKTTGDPRWIKSAAEMSRTIQMTSYGKWVITVAPSTEHVRLSHCYFVTRGSARPRKVTLRVQPEQIVKQAEHCEGVALSLKHAVAESDPERVPANVRSCDKYGGCPARAVCTASMHGGLRAIIGASAAQALTGDNDMINFFDQLRGGTGTPAAAPQPVAATLGLGGVLDAPGPGPAAKAKAEVEALAQIKAEEAASKERSQFLAMCDRVEQIAAQIPGLGFPHLGGQAAKIYAAAKGYQLSGSAGGYAGSGKLGTIKADGSPALMVMDAPTMAQLVVDLENHLRVSQAQAAAPPPAAQANPLLSPETPSTPAPAPTQAPQAMTITTPPDEPKAKRKKAASPVAVNTNPPVATGTDASVGSHAPAAASAGVATTPTGPISLAPFVDHLVGTLQKHFEAAGWPIADIRCAPQESPLGFGKWKGGLYAHALEQAPKLPAGATLTIDTRGSEFAEIVAAALAQYARTTGAFTLVVDAAVDGSVIRGIR